MIDDATQTSTISPTPPAPRSNPLLFLAICGLFMLVGILVLAWLGTDRSRTAVGKQLPALELEPLVYADQSLIAEQLVGKPTLLYLWSPEAKNTADELQQIDKIAKDHPEYALVTIAFSQGSLVPELLRVKAQEQLEKLDVNWPTYVDLSGRASLDLAILMPYGSFGFPTIFVINPQGRIQYLCEARKPEDWQVLVKQLEK